MNMKYKEYKQQLTVKSATMEDFVRYSEEDKTKFLDNPILLARKSTSDSDNLYLHKALKTTDSEKCKEAMLEEINQHIKKRNWEPVLKSDLTVNTTILPSSHIEVKSLS
jgi:hypothetical protein